MPTIGFIGVGEIASAIIEGLEAAGTEGDATGYSFALSPRNAERSARLAATIPMATICPSNQAVVDRSELIVLAVLPQQAEAVLSELDIPAEKTLVSAVAGVSVDKLSGLLPHAPSIVRVIPLPAVRERRGVTAIHPADDAVEEIFDHLGGSVIAETEELFSTLSAATATMSGHFAYLDGIAGWLEDQGWKRADADHFVRGQFVGLGTTLAETDLPVSELIAAHETPGGLNAMLRAEWMDADNSARLAAALDHVHDRVTGRS